MWSKHLQKISGKKELNNLSRFDIYKGLDCMRNGQTDDGSKTFFEKAIKKSPDNSQAYKFLGDM